MLGELVREAVVVDEPDALEALQHVVDLLGVESGPPQPILKLAAASHPDGEEAERALVAALRRLRLPGPLRGWHGT
jgi:hypothetical protein